MSKRQNLGVDLFPAEARRQPDNEQQITVRQKKKLQTTTSINSSNFKVKVKVKVKDEIEWSRMYIAWRALSSPMGTRSFSNCKGGQTYEEGVNVETSRPRRRLSLVSGIPFVNRILRLFTLVRRFPVKGKKTFF